MILLGFFRNKCKSLALFTRECIEIEISTIPRGACHNSAYKRKMRKVRMKHIAGDEHGDQSIKQVAEQVNNFLQVWVARVYSIQYWPQRSFRRDAVVQCLETLSLDVIPHDQKDAKIVANDPRKVQGGKRIPYQRASGHCTHAASFLKSFAHHKVAFYGGVPTQPKREKHRGRVDEDRRNVGITVKNH